MGYYRDDMEIQMEQSAKMEATIADLRRQLEAANAGCHAAQSFREDPTPGLRDILDAKLAAWRRALALPTTGGVDGGVGRPDPYDDCIGEY